MTIQVIPTAIHAAARHLGAVSEVVHDQIPTQVDGLSAALPGTLSGPTASQLSTAWQGRFVHWCQHVKRQSETLHHNADNWSETDQTIGAHFQRMITEIGER